MASRRDKGREIAFEKPEAVSQTEEAWFVKGTRDLPYRVDYEHGFCTCPDKTMAEDPNHRCKHWWAVWFKAASPVRYKVKRQGDGWCVAVTRMGVELVRLSPCRTREEAEAIRSSMVGTPQVEKTAVIV